MAQKPHGPPDTYCPLWRKAMAKVCHTCPWWTQVRGKNPQTGADVDDWNCAIAWLPMIGVQAAREAAAGAAETSAFRAEAAQNNAQQASNMAALNDNLITMHAQNTQLAIAQIRTAKSLSPPPPTQHLLEDHGG
jgi:hypothetical protein